MENKTCRECKNLDRKWYFCRKSGLRWMRKEQMSCNDFAAIQPPTNGDVIRRMSNEELATWGMYDLGTCPTFEKRQSCPKRGECSASEVEDCWREWLNAPADCVSQNGKNDTQTDLCCTDNTQKEVKQ